MNKITLMLSLIFLVGCATMTTPKEVVELSQAVGENLESVHKSYKELVLERYELLRAERLAYLNNSWTPAFLSEWTEKGKLVEVATGKAVWSSEERRFIEPSGVVSNELKLKIIDQWAKQAIFKIENKKKVLITPLENDEKELLNSIDNVFNQLYRANAAITAHLNSTRKVEEVQSQLLESLKVKDFQTKITKLIVEGSEKAAKSFEEIKKLDQKLTENLKK